MALAVVLFSAACGGSVTLPSGGNVGGDAGEGGADSGLDAGGDAALPPTKLPVPLTTARPDKLDVLFLIDNSASMGDKQALLALAIPEMIGRLAEPNCVDAASGTAILGPSSNGSCAAFANSTIEFPPVRDMHLGIVTSSLGSRGGDECPDGIASPVNSVLSAHENDRGELIARGGVLGDPTVEGTVEDAHGNGNFLAWFPTGGSNATATAPPIPLTALGPGEPSPTGSGDGTLIGDFAEMIEGVHEHGCGFEAQNEAWYRFLVQPDPFATISLQNSVSVTSGIDETILQQRAAFLRPDSVVVVIVVTDENEEVTNPNAVFKQSWAFENTSFPGSPGTLSTAPEATIECEQPVDTTNPSTSGPNGPNCTSCGFASVKSSSNFALRCPRNGLSGAGGYLDPGNDFPNIRFYHPKYRFGVDTMYPTSRYTRGLTQKAVPDQCHETVGGCSAIQLAGAASAYVGDQAANADCVNPLYAQNLPTNANQELCHLTPGPRTPDRVFYAAIAGVPHQLLQAIPGETGASGTIDCPAGTNAADCRQKSSLTEADWLLITGRDPENYDFTGADFHMIESTVPRVKGWLPDGKTMPANFSTCPPPAPGAATPATDACDPINGREWNTSLQDLQFACIFPLSDSTGAPATKDCTSAQYRGACDCSSASYTAGTQLCQLSGGGSYTTTQAYGKAYPSVREMVIAHSMGAQGIVSSLCPIHPSPVGGDTDPLFGYRPAVNAVIDRLKTRLGVPCLPEELPRDPTCGSVPCLVIATRLGGAPGLPGTCANPGTACEPTQGLLGPQPDNPSSPPPYPQSAASSFCAALHAAWLATGDTNAGDDPDLRPACAIPQLVAPNGSRSGACAFAPEADFDATGSCAGSTDPGWCYATGAAASGCPDSILFTSTEPPAGWTANLQCRN